DAQALEERWTMLGLTNRAGNNNADEESQRPETPLVETLQEYLQEQLRLTRAQPRDCALVSLLIDELDENGYLLTGLDEILTFLPAELGVEHDELQAALRLLQSFDPSGVAARSLSECLGLQLNHLQA